MFSGRFAVDRSIWRHPLFLGEPFTRREAFLWLCSEASFKDRTVEAAGRTIVLHRGQLSHSVRFMAEKWGWSAAKVQRFLAKLKRNTSIDTRSGTAQTVITIRNYDTYQASVGRRDAPSDTAGGSNKNKDPESRNNNGGGGTLAALESELRSAAGDALRVSAPGLFVLAAPQRWLDQGAELERDIIPAIRSVASKAKAHSIASWEYFDRAVCEASDARQRACAGTKSNLRVGKSAASDGSDFDRGVKAFLSKEAEYDRQEDVV